MKAGFAVGIEAGWGGRPGARGIRGAGIGRPQRQGSGGKGGGGSLHCPLNS
jgi:hypothetical protein